MYSFITVISGMILAIMVAINGELSAIYGVFLSSVIIHIVGTIFAFLVILMRNEKLLVKPKAPKWFYLGGMIGVSTTVFQNIAFKYISMTSIIALGLLGQTFASLVVDQFGLFGMRKIPPLKSVLSSLAFAILGIVLMLDGSIGKSAITIYKTSGGITWISLLVL